MLMSCNNLHFHYLYNKIVITASGVGVLKAKPYFVKEMLVHNICNFFQCYILVLI